MNFDTSMQQGGESAVEGGSVNSDTSARECNENLSGRSSP